MARRRKTRGYPLAQLIGLEENQACLWNVYSESIKPGSHFRATARYTLYESIIDALRPGIARGVTSVLIATSDDKKYAGFMEHLRRRHGWLLRSGTLSRTAFAQVSGPATGTEQVRNLVKSEEFRQKLEAVLEDDQKHIINFLDQLLSSPEGPDAFLFSLKDVEDAVYGDVKDVEYILLSEGFRDMNRGRVDRLLQIAGNKKIRTKTIRKATAAEARISQFGGLLCILER